MDHDIKTLRQFAELPSQLWRETAGFLLSIELWMMLLLSWATVAGFWLAFMRDLLCLLPFGFAVAYPIVRVTLHIKRILHWSFIQAD